VKPYTETLLRAALVAHMEEENRISIENAKVCKIGQALDLATVLCISLPNDTAKAKALAAIVAQAHTEIKQEHETLKSEIEDLTK
jgi:hypothetical protein